MRSDHWRLWCVSDDSRCEGDCSGMTFRNRWSWVASQCILEYIKHRAVTDLRSEMISKGSKGASLVFAMSSLTTLCIGSSCPFESPLDQILSTRFRISPASAIAAADFRYCGSACTCSCGLLTKALYHSQHLS